MYRTDATGSWIVDLALVQVHHSNLILRSPTPALLFVWGWWGGGRRGTPSCTWRASGDTRWRKRSGPPPALVGNASLAAGAETVGATEADG